MAVFEQFPYTNFHELNLDWIIKQMKDVLGSVEELSAKLDSELEQTILEYLNEHLDEIMLTATYIESTRTLKIGGNV